MKLWRSKWRGPRRPGGPLAAPRTSDSLLRPVTINMPRVGWSFTGANSVGALRFSRTIFVHNPDRLVSGDPNTHSGAHPALFLERAFWGKTGKLRGSVT